MDTRTLRRGLAFVGFCTRYPVVFFSTFNVQTRTRGFSDRGTLVFFVGGPVYLVVYVVKTCPKIKRSYVTCTLLGSMSPTNAPRYALICMSTEEGNLSQLVDWDILFSKMCLFWRIFLMPKTYLVQDFQACMLKFQLRGCKPPINATQNTKEQLRDPRPKKHHER